MAWSPSREVAMMDELARDARTTTSANLDLLLGYLFHNVWFLMVHYIYSFIHSCSRCTINIIRHIRFLEEAEQISMLTLDVTFHRI